MWQNGVVPHGQTAVWVGIGWALRRRNVTQLGASTNKQHERSVCDKIVVQIQDKLVFKINLLGRTFVRFWPPGHLPLSVIIKIQPTVHYPN